MPKRQVVEPYRKVSLATWHREQFRALSPLAPCGQGLYLYLHTGPAATPLAGLVRGGRAALAEELDWPLKSFDRAFAELDASGLATADWPARLVYLPLEVATNLPTSPQTITSTYRRHLGLLPPCDLLRRALRDIHAQLVSESPGLAKILAKEVAHLMTMAEGDAIHPSHGDMPSPHPGTGAVTGAVTGTGSGRDQEEPRADDVTSADIAARPYPALARPIPVPRDAWLSLVDCWNRACASTPEWVQVSTTLQPASQARLLKALRSTPDLDAWDARFARAASSNHLTNRNGKGFVSDLWWVLEHVDELDAGRYDDRQTRPTKVAALTGGGVARTEAAEVFSCHHSDDQCPTRSACELRTARAVGKGQMRLEDVPLVMRSVVEVMAPAYEPKAVSA